MDIPEPIRQLMEQQPELKFFIESLVKKIEQLEQKLGETEKEKLPFLKPNNRRRHSKPGRKEGHEGTSRHVPAEIHEEVELKAECCPHCNTGLGEPVESYTRYVEDIQPAKPSNRKYNVRRYWCTKCRKLVHRKVPDAIPHSRFGIKLMLWVDFQRHAMNMPFPKIRQELASHFGIEATEASLYNGVKRLARIFGKEYERIKVLMRLLCYVYFDDTGWRVNGKNAYLWDFINSIASLYIIARTRGGKIPKHVLGKNYDGIAVSDFYPSFDNLPFRQQKCWLHILRKTRDNCNLEVRRLHKRLKRLLRDAIGGLGEERLLGRLDEICSEGYRTRICRKVSKLLRKHRESMFRFVGEEGLDYHNNNSESGLRNVVIMRKVTGGSRSWEGAEVLAINKSVIESWRKQGKDFFEYGMEYVQKELGLTS